MITLTLLGSVALLWAVIHFIWRGRRQRRNAYSRFLKDHSIEDLQMNDLRTLKLRIATQESRATKKPDSVPPKNDESAA